MKLTLSLAFLFFANALTAQVVVKPINVAVFAPLYLDSVYNPVGDYKYGELIPTFAIPGIEFYYGAKAAIDSLKAGTVAYNFFVYDSKSTAKPISSLIADSSLATIDLIIASTVGNDIKQLADYALRKNIACISATQPNDAGVLKNPNFLLLNTTLKSNCKALHELIQKKFSSQRIVLLTKEGKMEDRITGYYKEFENSSTQNSLAIQYLSVTKASAEGEIIKNLDSTVLTTYIIASTDWELVKTLANVVTTYQLQDQVNVMGLPTWNEAELLNGKDFAGIRMYYPTPFITPTSWQAKALAATYDTNYGSEAGDNIYRGYETVFKYCNLYNQYTKDLPTNFGSNNFTTLYTTDIQPVFTNSIKMELDYFENKKVNITKRYSGITTTVKL